MQRCFKEKNKYLGVRDELRNHKLNIAIICYRLKYED